MLIAVEPGSKVVFVGRCIGVKQEVVVDAVYGLPARFGQKARICFGQAPVQFIHKVDEIVAQGMITLAVGIHPLLVVVGLQLPQKIV